MLIYPGFLPPPHTEVLIITALLLSIAFSLFNVCWALASFNKNISREDVEKLVLTWIGVLFQLCWRLGTVSSRVIALVVYWSAYGW